MCSFAFEACPCLHFRHTNDSRAFRRSLSARNRPFLSRRSLVALWGTFPFPPSGGGDARNSPLTTYDDNVVFNPPPKASSWRQWNRCNVPQSYVALLVVDLGVVVASALGWPCSLPRLIQTHLISHDGGSRSRGNGRTRGLRDKEKKKIHYSKEGKKQAGERCQELVEGDKKKKAEEVGIGYCRACLRA